MGRWSTSPMCSTVHEGQISAGVGLKWCRWPNVQEKLQLTLSRTLNLTLTRTLCFTFPQDSFSIPNLCLAQLTLQINGATEAPECSPAGVVTLEQGAWSRTCFCWTESHLGHRMPPAPLFRQNCPFSGPSATWCAAALLFPAPLKHPGEPGWKSMVWRVLVQGPGSFGFTQG